MKRLEVFAHPKGGLLGLLVLAAASCSSPKKAETAASAARAGDPAASYSAAEFPEEDYRQSQPAAGEPRPFQLPSINHFKLGDSIDVYLAEQHDLPTIAAEINFEGGGINDPRGKEGLAGVCMEMMSEGTRALDKLAFEEALANIASSISSYERGDNQGVSMRTLSKNLQPTLELFFETLTRPGFRKAELQRLVARYLESLKQIRGAPGSVAGRVVGSVLYGANHPLGAIETESSLKKITTGDCVRYHKAYIKPKGARLFIVGDMTEDQVRASFAPLLETWKGAPKKSARISAPKTRKGKVFFVNIPGAEQSTIWLGHFGPKRTAPDYFASEILGGILGGSFSSRLNMNLREAKGYSYGARGGFQYNRYFGNFGASASVRSDATRQSLREAFSEISALAEATRPVTPEEIEREKNGTILGLPAEFASANDTLRQYQTLIYYGLPLDYYESFVDRVSAVTGEMAMASATAHLRPEELVVLVVGDGAAPQIVRGDDGVDTPLLDAEGAPVTLAAALAEIAASDLGGKGELVRLDADGNVLKKR